MTRSCGIVVVAMRGHTDVAGPRYLIRLGSFVLLAVSLGLTTFPADAWRASDFGRYSDLMQSQTDTATQQAAWFWNHRGYCCIPYEKGSSFTPAQVQSDIHNTSFQGNYTRTHGATGLAGSIYPQEFEYLSDDGVATSCAQSFGYQTGTCIYVHTIQSWVGTNCRYYFWMVVMSASHSADYSDMSSVWCVSSYSGRAYVGYIGSPLETRATDFENYFFGDIVNLGTSIGTELADESWRVNEPSNGVYAQYYGDGNYNGYTH